jgi:hypothetical protein
MTVAQNVINHLRDAGVRIALDDFGTGYATLSQLLSFRLDRIKIDRSFVERLGKDMEGDTIVRAILGLAKGFGLATTAEGIEDADQLASLMANGCLEGQGYYFGKAIPAKQVEALLGKRQPNVKVLSNGWKPSRKPALFGKSTGCAAGARGFRIAAEAGHLDKALELAGSIDFDLALLDVNIDGELITPVAKLIAARGLPIIFATGYGAMGLPDEFRGHAALSKPFELSALRTTIDAATKT